MVEARALPSLEHPTYPALFLATDSGAPTQRQRSQSALVDGHALDESSYLSGTCLRINLTSSSLIGLVPMSKASILSMTKWPNAWLEDVLLISSVKGTTWVISSVSS